MYKWGLAMSNAENDYTFSMVEDCPATRMVVLGAGGMGNNAMENMARSAVTGLEYYSLNTDVQALRRCRGSRPVQLGAKRTGGKGAGGDSDMGRMSAEDDAEKIRKIVKGAELVFIASGMGGGTGTGAAPVIAKICREIGVLSICVVTMPMECEGARRTEKARAGLAELRKYVDSLLIIENEKLSMVMDQEDVSIIEVFRRADKVVVDTVTAVVGIINSHGYINLDLADLKKVLQRGDNGSCVDAFVGVGEASGPERAQMAADMALNNPLLRECSISGAVNLLVNVAGSDQIGHKEAMNAVKRIVEKAGDLDREIFMGVVTDNSMAEKLSVTVIATGLSPRTATVVPMRGMGPQVKKTADEGREAGVFRSIRIPSRMEPEKSFVVDSGIHAEQESIVKPGIIKSIPDGFGVSPLICKDVWHTPAYLRRKANAGEAPDRQEDSRVQEIYKRDKDVEFETIIDPQVEKGQCRQDYYHMAS